MPLWYMWCTWNPVEGAGSNATIVDTDAVDGARSLRIEPIGVENWHFIVVNMPIPLEIGTEYTASFWAKAEQARPIRTNMKSTDNLVDFALNTHNLTTEWAEYTFIEEAPNPNNNIKLQFITNDALGISYWLDFVFCYAGEYVAGIEPSGLSKTKAAVRILRMGRWMCPVRRLSTGHRESMPTHMMSISALTKPV